MIAYVNRDAKRRGMSSGLWTFLVMVLTPAYFAIGFILYFLMRQPLALRLPTMRKDGWRAIQFLPELQMQPASVLPAVQAWKSRRTINIARNCACDLHNVATPQVGPLRPAGFGPKPQHVYKRGLMNLADSIANAFVAARHKPQRTAFTRIDVGLS